MICKTILSILLCTIYCAAQTPTTSTLSIADDQINWVELWKAMNKSKSSDGRSDVADSTRPSLFDTILRANAQARRNAQRSGESEFLFQGDIAIDKVDVIGMLSRGGRRKRAVMKKVATRLWQPNQIAYVISSDLGSFTKRSILAAIKQWEDTLPCMGKWQDIGKLGSTKRPRDYIRFMKGQGCYSRVGRQRGRQVVSIGTGCEHVGVVVHEIGHAMGFWHEQSRTDRDKYVEIHWDNILPAMKFNFEKYTSSKIDDLGVGYDYESVMHYNAKAFSKDGRALTISIRAGKGQKGVKLGQRYRLSDKDKKQAQLLYCNTVQACVDKDTRCVGWGKNGYCSPEKGYEAYMKKTCCTTCRSVKRLPCSSSPCLNSGVCRNNGDKYSCTCTSAFTGSRCETKVSPCSSGPCMNGGVCSNNGDKYSCRCTSGYTGVRCETKTKVSGVCTGNKQTQYNCERWKDYCVYGSKYYSYMKKNCCKTCKENCKDKHTFCARWSKSGFCKLANFKAYMQKNCVVSCKFPC